MHFANTTECERCGIMVSQKHSHNGMPKYEGRVCSTCNDVSVLPYRFLMMMMSRENLD